MHEADLFDANPVLARHAASTIQTLLKDFMAGGDDALGLFGIAFVKQQDRMDVTIARVKNIHDANVMLAADFGDALQDMRQLGAWYDSVLRTVAGTETTDCPKRLLATFPQPLSLGGI